MRLGAPKNTLSLFLLILFLGVKLAGLHVFLHYDKDQHAHCTICDHWVKADHSQKWLYPKADFSFKSPEKQICSQPQNPFTKALLGDPTIHALFCRPPPSC